MKPCENCGGTEIKQAGIKKMAEKYADIFDKRFYYWTCTKCGKDYDLEKAFNEAKEKKRGKKK